MAADERILAAVSCWLAGWLHIVLEMASAAPPRLVLHFDVNETIMVGDPAGGDSFEESLNKICAKSAVIRPSDDA